MRRLKHFETTSLRSHALKSPTPPLRLVMHLTMRAMRARVGALVAVPSTLKRSLSSSPSHLSVFSVSSPIASISSSLAPPCSSFAPLSSFSSSSPSSFSTPSHAPYSSSHLFDHMYGEEHRALRKTVDTFMERHVQGHIETWEAAGCLPRAIFQEV